MSENQPQGNGQKQLKQISIKYTRSKDYKMIPANGMQMGALEALRHAGKL